VSKPNHGDDYYAPDTFNPESGMPPDDGELTMPHPDDEED
jgi:hypothetical protein